MKTDHENLLIFTQLSCNFSPRPHLPPRAIFQSYDLKTHVIKNNSKGTFGDLALKIKKKFKKDIKMN